MNAQDKLKLQAKIAEQASPKARELAHKLANTTSLGGRFDLTDVSKLEAFLLGALWLLEQDIAANLDRDLPWVEAIIGEGY